MDLSVYVPLGILGLIRWGAWLIRRIPASLYRPAVGGRRQPISLVTPVYQEDPPIFREALNSWIAAGVDEIICVIDVTDTRCIWLARSYAKHYNVKIILTDVPGKRDALRRGWEAASNEIVALVDSDTLWADDVVQRVCEPFGDPRVGGVGTRQNVYNPETIWQKINDFYLDYRYFDEQAAQSRMGAAVSCLSGRTAVYRRSILLDISEEFMHERWLGVPCNSGDDKRLTSLVMKRGHRTFMQRNARVWSTFPPDRRRFFKQRIRWARNTWRSDLRALFSGWAWKRPFLLFCMVDKMVSSFTLLVSPVFMAYAIVNQDWVIVGLLAAWWVVSRSAKNLPHLERRPSDLLLMPAFILISFLMAGVKVYALLTMRKQLWLTRSVGVVDGQIVRMGDAADTSNTEAATAEVGQVRTLPVPPLPPPLPSAAATNGNGVATNGNGHGHWPSPALIDLRESDQQAMPVQTERTGS